MTAAKSARCRHPRECGRGNIRDQVVPVLLLLQATERHLGPRDVLLGVLEVLKLHSLVDQRAVQEKQGRK